MAYKSWNFGLPSWIEQLGWPFLFMNDQNTYKNPDFLPNFPFPAFFIASTALALAGPKPLDVFVVTGALDGIFAGFRHLPNPNLPHSLPKSQCSVVVILSGAYFPPQLQSYSSLGHFHSPSSHIHLLSPRHFSSLLLLFR